MEKLRKLRASSPADWWRHYQETITWIETNRPSSQRRNRPRTRKTCIRP